MKSSIPLRDRLIPWYFVLFFVVLAIVDGIMVTLAVTTQTGLVTDHPYEKGLAYNQVVEASDSQEKLHWKGSIDHRVTGHNAISLEFSLQNANNHPIKTSSVTANIVRPTSAHNDFTIPLQQSSPGRTTAQIDFPQGGLWEIRIFAVSGNQHYQQTKRIVIQ